jgi:Na+-transporting NADH:ubiquinone oxidoreductase subunit F
MNIIDYLAPILVMGGLAVALAVILAITSSLLQRGAEYKVRVTNDGNQWVVRKWGENLMDVLSDAGYGIMAACAGSGTCGTCRVKILEGLEEPTPAQLGPLKGKLREEGWVLSCQTTVTDDLVIELFEPLVQSWPKDKEDKEKRECSECSQPCKS